MHDFKHAKYKIYQTQNLLEQENIKLFIYLKLLNLNKKPWL